MQPSCCAGLLGYLNMMHRPTQSPWRFVQACPATNVRPSAGCHPLAGISSTDASVAGATAQIMNSCMCEFSFFACAPFRQPTRRSESFGRCIEIILEFEEPEPEPGDRDCWQTRLSTARDSFREATFHARRHNHVDVRSAADVRDWSGGLAHM